MKKHYLILIFIFFVSLAKGQNYIPYFHKITEVENQIRKHEFSSALESYESLFQEYDNISYKNLHNACICAIKTQEYNKAIEYAQQLVFRGYELKDFEQTVFDELREKKSKWNSFIKGYEELRIQQIAKLNKE